MTENTLETKLFPVFFFGSCFGNFDIEGYTQYKYTIGKNIIYLNLMRNLLEKFVNNSHRAV